MSRRAFFFALPLFAAIGVSTPASACEIGEFVTVNSKIISFDQYPGSWEFNSDDRTSQSGCNIFYVEGAGQLPPSCSNDRSFTASGYVAKQKWGDVFLQATEITCR